MVRKVVTVQVELDLEHPGDPNELGDCIKQVGAVALAQGRYDIVKVEDRTEDFEATLTYTFYMHFPEDIQKAATQKAYGWFTRIRNKLAEVFKTYFTMDLKIERMVYTDDDEHRTEVVFTRHDTYMPGN